MLSLPVCLTNCLFAGYVIKSSTGESPSLALTTLTPSPRLGKSPLTPGSGRRQRAGATNTLLCLLQSNLKVPSHSITILTVKKKFSVAVTDILHDYLRPMRDNRCKLQSVTHKPPKNYGGRCNTNISAFHYQFCRWHLSVQWRKINMLSCVGIRSGYRPLASAPDWVWHQFLTNRFTDQPLSENEQPTVSRLLPLGCYRRQANS